MPLSVPVIRNPLANILEIVAKQRHVRARITYARAKINLKKLDCEFSFSFLVDGIYISMCRRNDRKAINMRFFWECFEVFNSLFLEVINFAAKNCITPGLCNRKF